MLLAVTHGAPAWVTVTITDGLVLARSARIVEDRQEQSRAMYALVDHLVPGRSRETRMPSDAELDATLILAFPITEASAKVRTGPPIDDEIDHALDIWAGEIPLFEGSQAAMAFVAVHSG